MLKDRRKILKFIISGGISATVEYGLFYCFVHIFIMQVIYAQPVSFVCSLFNSYILNKLWVFEHDKESVRRSELVLFGSLAVFNLVITTFFMDVLVHVFGINALIVKLLLMGCVAGWNYFIFNKVIFKK